MDSGHPSSLNRFPAEPQDGDPGAYPIPFRTDGVELGSRLDSIPASLRYWAVDKKRADAHWYNKMVAANNRYEEWLSTTRTPGEFALPRGINNEYTGMPIEDVPQDAIWWGLRPSNCDRGWYQALYEANRRFLDDVYRSRSPGSEAMWAGKYKGHRLDQVYERKNYIRWCFDPQREESGWLCRLKDLVHRLEEWRLAHPERSTSRRRRRAPNIQNPVGEAIGLWDDSLGSADENEYETDSFVQSDNDEIIADEDSEGDTAQDSDESGGSSLEMTPAVRQADKRRSRTNMILSDEEDSEVELEDNLPVERLGKRYRLQPESEEEFEVLTRKARRRLVRR